eukprot:19170-Heterococcus_DN1.PRE.4
MHGVYGAHEMPVERSLSSTHIEEGHDKANIAKVDIISDRNFAVYGAGTEALEKANWLLSVVNIVIANIRARGAQ